MSFRLVFIGIDEYPVLKINALSSFLNKINEEVQIAESIVLDLEAEDSRALEIAEHINREGFDLVVIIGSRSVESVAKIIKSVGLARVFLMKFKEATIGEEPDFAIGGDLVTIPMSFSHFEEVAAS